MWDYLESKAREAKASPAQLNRYLRLHLNVRTKQLTRWLPIERFDATRQLIDDSEWKGKVVTGGLDLSTSSDFTAFCFRGRDAERGHPVHWLYWLPEEQLNTLALRTKMPLQRWVDEGWLKLTEGNVVDYAKVRADITTEEHRLGVVFSSIAYDPWNASETVVAMMDDGYNMVPVRQGYANLSPATKSIERLVLGSTPDKPMVRTGSNPISRWMADCVEVRTDDNGNIKPVKPDRGKSSKRIDGMSAWVMAEREAMATEDTTSGQDYIEAMLAKHAQ
jgi:phage terminase large subunit-like protein